MNFIQTKNNFYLNDGYPDPVVLLEDGDPGGIVHRRRGVSPEQRREPVHLLGYIIKKKLLSFFVRYAY